MTANHTRLGRLHSEIHIHWPRFSRFEENEECRHRFYHTIFKLTSEGFPRYRFLLCGKISTRMGNGFRGIQSRQYWRWEIHLTATKHYTGMGYQPDQKQERHGNENSGWPVPSAVVRERELNLARTNYSNEKTPPRFRLLAYYSWIITEEYIALHLMYR